MADGIELRVDDADDFDAVYAELRGQPGILVQTVSGPVDAGSQSASTLDLLTVACSSGGAVTVFLHVIKEVVKSRGPHIVIRLRRGKDRLKVTADNVDDVLPAIKELLDGS